MARVIDTDLILVNRAGVDYKVTYKEWKDSNVSITAPQILSPTTGATGVKTDLTLTSSAFMAVGVTHKSTDWQITLPTDTAFAAPIAQLMGSTTSLTSWKASGLANETAYICRVRYTGSDGTTNSPWSNTVSFTTEKADPLATVRAGSLYYKTTQTTSGPFLPTATALPANADGTSYIDIASCADSTPGVLLGTGGKLWVTTSSRAAPVMAAPSGLAPGAKFVKICGGANPSYAGNCLALADDGTLWRGWSLSSGLSWTKVTGVGFDTADVTSLMSQAYSTQFWVRVRDKSTGKEGWWTVDGAAQALVSWAQQTNAASCIQVVMSNPLSGATATAYGLTEDGRVINARTGAAVYSTKPVIKLVGAGYDQVPVVAICLDGTAHDLVSNSAIPSPASKQIVDLIVTCNNGSYTGRNFCITSDKCVYMTSSNAGIMSLSAGAWIELTDLKGKVTSFGSTSSQAPIIGDQFHLIVPN